MTLILPEQWSTDRYGKTAKYQAKPERETNYAVVPIPYRHGKTSFYRSWNMILPQISPDVLFVAQERYDWSTLQAIAYGRLWVRGVKIIGGSSVNIEYKLNRLRYRWKERFFVTATDAIVAVNEEARRLLRAHGFSKPILVMSGIGADEILWHPAQGPEDKILEEARCFEVGYVGALLREKGVLDLARALVELDESWRLVVIGDGPMRNEMEHILSGRKSNQYVDFQGMIPRGEIPPLMRTFDALVLPSRTTNTWKEQFGLVLAEAMLCGVAVVGSDSGAIPEVIGNAGLLFPEGDIRALRNCLRLLLEDPVLRRELGRSGRQRAMERFSVTAMSEDFYNFCKSLLE